MLRHAIIVTAFCGSRDTETCTIVNGERVGASETATLGGARERGRENPHELQRPDRGRSRKECFQRSVSTKRSLATSSWR
ncbi:hypothetical protein MTP99_003429 [Tenebrio molitor]|nr:hypothetical protein MTP99_003429 [Tenebrio molitor]